MESQKKKDQMKVCDSYRQWTGERPELIPARNPEVREGIT